ncbi:MAG: CheR family methyltransferase [Polyangia bacterium]
MTPKSLRAEEPATADEGDAETAQPDHRGPGPSDRAELPVRERPSGSPRFFHPPDSFAALRAHVFPTLLRERQAADVLRIWVVGCSTGEKVYSLAMALSERLEAEQRPLQLILYGTDLDGTAIEQARRGCFPRSIAEDLEPERLRRCFSEFEGSFRINPALRSRCVFACHNPLSDPPLSQMDLVDCRGVLTHLEPALQEHLQRLLEYALKPGGFLLLGPSEQPPLQREQLALVDARQKLYKKRLPLRECSAEPTKEPGRTKEADPALPVLSVRPSVPVRLPPQLDPQELAHEVERVLIDRYVPPGVLINAAGDVLQVHGETAPFLVLGPGHHRLSLFELAREELRAELRAALSRAQKSAESAATQVRVGERAARLRIVPVLGAAATAQRCWVLFEPLGDPDGSDGEAPPADTARLKEELCATRSYLESVLLQQEASSEELQGVSEEVRSAQDELGVLQEALALAQHELQQRRRQLSALSDELSQRERDLLRLHDDLKNLVSEVPLPVVLVGSDLRVRRFTPPAAQLLPLGPQGTGRSLRELAANAEPADERPAQADLADLADLAEQALRSARPAERELTARGGRRYLARASPYRTQDQRTDGAVLVFIPR